MLNLNTEFIFFDLVVAFIDLLYLYYWITVLIAQLNKHIDIKPVTSEKLHVAFLDALKKKNPHKFVIQITTKGGVPKIVARGVDNVLLAANKYSILKLLISIEIITEDEKDEIYFKEKFKKSPVPLSIYRLPHDYMTPNNTKLKARALHYMVEVHRLNPKDDAYIVHYDEESVLTPDNVARLVLNLLKNPAELSEGSISYGSDWKQANLLCRAIESNRPFGCHECYVVMKNPPAYHLHGSNLVVREKLENEIGWDFGTYKSSPLVAEDLVFGLKAYVLYGAKIFGWHHAEMIEQPPFTLNAAVKQRERWVFGAMQALGYIRRLPEWQELTSKDKNKIMGVIYMRVMSFALGFPISILSLLINVYLFINLLEIIIFKQATPHDTIFSFILLPGMFLWFGAVQFGLYFNLRYSDLNFWSKIKEHLMILSITPISSILETYGAFLAVVKYVVGIRSIAWVPTPKQFEISADGIKPAAKIALKSVYVQNQ